MQKRTEPNPAPEATGDQNSIRSYIRPYFIYLGTIIIWISSFKDFSQVGFRWDWVLFRFSYLPFMLAVAALSQMKRARKFEELPIWAAGAYITALVSYFSGFTGYFSSSYVNGLIQLYTVMAILPVSRFGFMGIGLSSILGFCSYQLLQFGVVAIPSRAVVSNLLPLLICPPIVHFIAAGMRKNINQLNERIRNLIYNQEKTIRSQSESIARAATREKLTTLATKVAHDIRSPLSALNMVVATAQNIGEDDRKLLQSVTDRIRNIANDLIQNYSQVQKAEDKTELVTTLQELVDQKRLEFANHENLAIQFRNASSFENRVYAGIDSSSLGRIISNLVNNSVEASGYRGEVAVELEVPNDHATITIRDFGVGIKPELLPHLMKPGVSFGKIGGTGLGLSIAREILTKHGGKLSLKSVPGSETIASIQLPLVPPFA